MADPAAAAQSGSAQNSGAGKGVKAVLAAGSKGSVSYFGPPPGGIRAGRPRPTRQAGRCTPPPLSGAPLQRVLYGPKGPVCCRDSLSDIPAAWVPIPPGSAHRVSLSRGGPAQGHPHPFRCAGMGVGCAAGGPLRRFNPGGPQTGGPQTIERSTYKWRFPGKCLRPPTSGGTDRRRPWTTIPPGWTGCWCWPQRRP